MRIDRVFRHAPRPSSSGGEWLGAPWAETLQRSWLRDQRVLLTKSLGHIVANQPRFTLLNDGTTIVPQTKAAADLLATSRGERLAQAIVGLESVTGSINHSPQSILEFALSDSRRGFAANTFMNIADGSRGLKTRLPSNIADPANVSGKKEGRLLAKCIGLDALMWRFNLGGANAEEGRIALSKSATGELMKALDDAERGKRGALARMRGDRIAYVTRHESEHTETPTLALDMAHLKFEEAIADALTRWPGVVSETAEAMGLAHLKSSKASWTRHPFRGYVDLTANGRVLLELAGIDTSVAASRSRAVALFQKHAVGTGAAEAIADEIIKVRGTAAGDRAVLANRVLAAASDRKALKRLVKDLGASGAWRPISESRAGIAIGMATDPTGAAILAGSTGVAFLAGRAHYWQTKNEGVENVSPRLLLNDAAIAGGMYLGNRIGGFRFVLPLSIILGGSIVGSVAGAAKSIKDNQ